jgi:sugar phosphate isomerase/epimerase
MGTIPLGDGAVGIESIVQALVEIGFTGDTTLEVAGTENVKTSLSRLAAWLSSAQPLRV